MSERNPSLVTSIGLHTFSSLEKDKLLDHLRQVEEKTIVCPLEHPNQILLDHNFRTLEGGCCFTSKALRQVCTSLGSGVNTAVLNMAGLTKYRHENYSFYSQADAAAVFNIFVRRRFERDILGLQVLRKSDEALIESVLGHSYRRLPNIRFLELIEELIPQAHSPLIFHDATLSGRRLLLRYRQAQPFVFLADDRLDPVYRGLFFSNDEVSEGAVRSTSFLLFSRMGAASVPYNKNNKVNHSGKDFYRRLQKMLAATVSGSIYLGMTPVELQRSVTALRNRSLGFTGINADKDEIRFCQLIEQLKVKSGTVGMCKAILRRALVAGGRPEVPGNALDIDRQKAWAKSNYLDFFVSLLVASSTHQHTLQFQEKYERLAYDMLLDRFSFV